MTFFPSFVVHIIVFLSSTVSPPISCFVKCICFFLSYCRYTDLLASRRNVALSDFSTQCSPVYLAPSWRSVALSGLILFLILILLLILNLILVGSHQSHLPSSSCFLIFLYALLHSSLLNDAFVTRFHVAEFLLPCINAAFLRSIFKRFIARLDLAGHFPQSSYRAPPAVTCFVQFLMKHMQTTQMPICPELSFRCSFSLVPVRFPCATSLLFYAPTNCERLSLTCRFPILQLRWLWKDTRAHNLLEFSVGALLSWMCSPCALTLNSMFVEYAFAFPHSRNRCLVKTSKHHTAWTPEIDTS